MLKKFTSLIAAIACCSVLSAASLSQNDMDDFNAEFDAYGYTDSQKKESINKIKALYDAFPDEKQRDALVTAFLDNKQTEIKASKNEKKLADYLPRGEVRYEYVKYDNNYAAGGGFKDDTQRTKAMLEFGGQYGDNVYASIRLGAYHDHGGATRNAFANIDSVTTGKPVEGRTVSVSRAYFLYTFNPYGDYKTDFFAGDLTSQDGPSMNIKSGDHYASGSYAADGFNGDGSGFGIRVGLDPILEGLKLKLITGQANKAGYINPVYDMGGFYGIDTNMKNTKVSGLFFDYERDNGNSISQIYYVTGKDLNANPGLGTGDTNIGNSSGIGIMYQHKNINLFGLKTDAFINLAQSEVNPNGQCVDMSATFGPTYSCMGLLTSTPNDSSTKKGNSVWLGAKVHLNSQWSLGYEYLDISKNYFAFTSGADEGFTAGGFDNVGTTHQLYTQYKIDNNLIKNGTFTLSYHDINSEYTSGHLGQRTKITNQPGLISDRSVITFITSVKF